MTEIDPEIISNIERRTGELRRILDTRKMVAGHIRALEMHTDALIGITVIPLGERSQFTTKLPTAVLLQNERDHLGRLDIRLMQMGAIPPSEPAPPPPWAPKADPVVPAPLPATPNEDAPHG